MSLPPPRSFVVFYHPKVNQSDVLARDIVAFLRERGLAAEPSSIDAEAKRAQAGEADMLIALGGDGTMLRVGRTGAFNHQPVLGINLGRVGFLVEVQPEAWQPALERVLAGDYGVEERMMLHASHRQNGAELRSYEALNEVVVGRGVVYRPVRLETCVDREHLADYVADGLIVATPTGSTAYSLAAGGPVVSPEMKAILVAPISPHLSFHQPLVLPPGAVVDITIRTDHDAALSIDGQTSQPVHDRDSLCVSLSENVARFVRLRPPAGFYRTLAERLGHYGILKNGERLENNGGWRQRPG